MGGRPPAKRERDRRRLQAEALADPTRFAAYQEIQRSDRALSVAEITDVVGVHHTAVRAHLAKLRDAGLIVESHAEPTGRGRPKLLYAPSPTATRDPYRELSSMLARVVREGSTPRAVGAAAGRDIVRRSEPTVPADPVDLIEREATELGFDPRRAGSRRQPELVLRHCPFADVAAQDPQSICALHLGVAEGIAAACGDLEVLGMDVRDPHRAGCRLRMRRSGTEEAG